MTSASTYGLLVNRELHYGKDYLMVRVVQRKDGDEHPLNPESWYAGDGKPYYDGLAMRGSVWGLGGSDRKAQFQTDKPEYHEVSYIKLSVAKAMVAVLAKIAKQIEKDSAYEPGDVFLAFARAIGAQWVAIPRKGRMERSSYSDNRWAWWGLTDGRNQYRIMIADMVQEEQDAIDQSHHTAAAEA